jgi:hypothetical protein
LIVMFAAETPEFDSLAYSSARPGIGRVHPAFRDAVSGLDGAPSDSLVLWTPEFANPSEVEALPDRVRLAWLRSAACVGWWSTSLEGAGEFESVTDVLEWAWSHPDRVMVRTLTQSGSDYAPAAGTLFASLAIGARTTHGPAVSVVKALARVCAEGLLPAGAKVARAALTAGLLTQHDHFDAAHAAAQSVEGEGQPPLGDHWHAILHRREPDYGNARYWYRQLGQAPAFAPLATWVSRFAPSECATSHSEIDAWRRRLVVGDVWQPFAMIDLCAACANRPATDPLVRFAAEVQAREMGYLLAETLRGTM